MCASNYAIKLAVHVAAKEFCSVMLSVSVHPGKRKRSLAEALSKGVEIGLSNS